MNELKTIRVTGRGMIRLKPDTTRITLTIAGISPDYTMLLKSSASDTARFRRALETVGFAREELETLRFQVQPEYEGYQEDGVYKQRLTGYRFVHELSFAFPSDNERLERILAALAGTGLRPEFSVSFTVKDREAAKNALLKAAVADAKAKAETLAAASGVTLLGIRHIRYSMNESEFAVRPVERSVFAAKEGADRFAPEIEPEEIEAEDTVSIVWEIE